MNPSPPTPMSESMTIAKTEQKFLRLAVQAAEEKYRELHTQVNQPQATCGEACSWQESAYQDAGFLTVQ